jgi:hypothetical protein
MAYFVYEPVFLHIESGEKTQNPKDRLQNMKSDFVFTVLGGFISGGIGFLSSWILDRMRRNKERAVSVENRRRDFLAFMEETRNEAVRTHVTKSFDFYFRILPKVKFAAALVRDDFTGEKRIEFNKVISDVCDLNETDIGTASHNTDVRSEILKRIDNVIEFIEHN